jgi:hypothetical protein
MTENKEQYKTTIVLPDNLYRRVKKIAAEKGESMGQVIRESIEIAYGERQPVPRSLGIGDSGRSDISERIDEFYKPDDWR